MIKLYTDAAYNPNTLEAGIGANYLQAQQQAIIQHYLPTVPNVHYAEFLALFFALKHLQQSSLELNIIWIHSDSQIVIDSIEKKHIKDQNLQEILAAILNLLLEYKLYFVKWIPGEENAHADHLARQALRLKKQYQSY